MTVTINGTNGIDKVAPGAIEKSDLPAGTVLQVVQGYSTTPLTTTTTSYIDTNSTATITPTSASSKVLVFITNPYQIYGGSDNGGGFQIVRNGTAIWVGNNALMYNYSSAGGNIYSSTAMNISYLDTPASTSALTYKLQVIARSGSTVITGYNNAPQTITLMEIAA